MAFFYGVYMTLIELTKYTSNESGAENYLRLVGILWMFDRCIHCDSSSTRKIRRNKIKCYKCKREWSLRNDSILSISEISYSKFILLIKCFELNFTISKTSEELQMNRKITRKFYRAFRSLIINKTMNDSSEVNKNNYTFGINSSNGKITIELCSPSTNNSSSHLIIGKRKTDFGKNVIYDFNLKTNSYVNKLGKGHLSNLEVNCFWSYTYAKLLEFNESSHMDLFYFLQEMAFRFNNLDEGIWNQLIEKLNHNQWVAKCAHPRSFLKN